MITGNESEAESMPAKNPLDDLCDAIRALQPATATRALNELLVDEVINFNETIECGRAINSLRVLVKNRDARAGRRPTN